MLVLSRKKGERIVLNENILVEVLEIRGDKVRLGFTAPRGVPIHREEVLRQSSVWRVEEDAEESEGGDA